MKPKFAFVFRTVLSICLALLVTGTLTSSLSASPVGMIWQDDFSSTTLDPRWSWINEVPDNWSLEVRPGFMRITTQLGFSVSNMLVQSVPVGDFTIETYMEFEPTVNYQGAGLFLRLDDTNSLSLIRAYCDWCGGNRLYFDHIEGGEFVAPNFAVLASSPNCVWLKIVRVGSTYTASYSENGTFWTEIGSHTLGFLPSVMGLTAHNSGGGAVQNADFDYFSLIDQSSFGYLPLVLR